VVATKPPAWTVKLTPLLDTPATVTSRFPVVAPGGTGAVIEAALQLIGVTAVPLNVTTPAPWLEPKPVPAITTSVPTVPVVGDRLVMVGTTVKFTALLGTPFTVTTRFPVVATVGTGTTIDPALQFVGVAIVPLNVTVLAPCVDPKFVPVRVTTVPTGPDGGDTLAILGVGSTVNTAMLLDSELLVTTTFPALDPAGTTTERLVGLHERTLAAIPSNVTTPEEPKLFPLTVTVVPTGPIEGDKLVMLGITVKDSELLAVPSAVFTTTSSTPGFARLGRETTIELLLQLKTDATAPAMVMFPDPCSDPRFAPEIVNCVPKVPLLGLTAEMLGS